MTEEQVEFDGVYTVIKEQVEFDGGHSDGEPGRVSWGSIVMWSK